MEDTFTNQEAQFNSSSHNAVSALNHLMGTLLTSTTTTTTTSTTITTNDYTLLHIINPDPTTPSILDDPVFTTTTTIIVFLGSINLSIIGICANVLCILVFHRQGLHSDSCTASLFCLSISDLTICLLKLAGSVCHTPQALSGMPFVTETQTSVNLSGLGNVINYHAVTLTALTTWITAFIALERMISVTFPFHVKRIFTPKRTYIVMVCIFAIVFLLYAPRTFYFTALFHDVSNTSVPIKYNVYVASGLVSRHLLNLTNLVVEFYLRLLFFIGITAMNVVLIIKVNSSRKFRQLTSATSSTPTTTQPTKQTEHTKADGDLKTEASSTTPTDGKTISRNKNDKTNNTSKKSNKETALTKMMISMCAMFVLCYFPLAFLALVMTNNIFTMPAWALIDNIGILTETINSSFNILIYISMSSRFNKEFRALCPVGKRT